MQARRHTVGKRSILETTLRVRALGRFCLRLPKYVNSVSQSNLTYSSGYRPIPSWT